jgi:hypothetical protein
MVVRSLFPPTTLPHHGVSSSTPHGVPLPHHGISSSTPTASHCRTTAFRRPPPTASRCRTTAFRRPPPTAPHCRTTAFRRPAATAPTATPRRFVVRPPRLHHVARSTQCAYCRPGSRTASNGKQTAVPFTRRPFRITFAQRATIRRPAAPRASGRLRRGRRCPVVRAGRSTVRLCCSRSAAGAGGARPRRACAARRA